MFLKFLILLVLPLPDGHCIYESAALPTELMLAYSRNVSQELPLRDFFPFGKW